MTLNGKRVLLTGAASGLGAATFRLLQQAGAHIIGIDRIPGTSEDRNQIIIADLRDANAVRNAVAQAIMRLGGLDILINNAGILNLQDAGMEPGKDVTDAMDVNFLGTWRVTAAALPALLESRGRVVNVASMFAVVNAPFIGAYAASKRAVTAYSDMLRFQYGDRVGVTTLYPGFVNTPIHDSAVRQGLSVGRLVSFIAGGRKVLSLEEPIAAAARGLVRACTGRPARDRGLTFLGNLTLLTARYVPSLVDWFVGWRLKTLTRAGELKVQLDSPTLESKANPSGRPALKAASGHTVG